MSNLDRSGRQVEVCYVLKFDEPAPSIKNYPTRGVASASSPAVSFSAGLGAVLLLLFSLSWNLPEGMRRPFSPGEVKFKEESSTRRDAKAIFSW